jgi:hypothetical protein
MGPQNKQKFNEVIPTHARYKIAEESTKKQSGKTIRRQIDKIREQKNNYI